MNPTLGRTEWLLLVALSLLWGAFLVLEALNNLIPFSLIV